MGAQRQRLLDLAASVADGTVDIDWKGLEASVHDDDDRQLLQDLRVLAGVAELHRSDEIPAPTVPVGRARVVGRIGPALAETDAPTVEERVLPPPSTRPLDHWGHLELIEQIGQGSFGNVYRARDTRLDRDVALKLLRKGRQTAELADKILHEGRILARVRHRNVVTVFGAEERDGRVGLWMEYIRGRTLEQLLRSTGSFGAREAALIGQELCRALAAVHKAGLVHRDIKAQNVMREEGGRLVLMDFGAGQFVDAAKSAPSGRLTGTPLYLAPELLSGGGDATIRSDIYSLGVLLFHLVTGQYPVSASSLDDLRQAHVEGRRLRLHDARPDLADDFARVVERALSADPQRRYASAGALQEALARSLGLDSTITVDREAFAAATAAAAAQPDDTPQPLATVPRRGWSFRWWQVAFAGFLLGAILVATLAWLLPRQQDTTLQRPASSLKPVIAIRPVTPSGASFDPLTFSVAANLSGRLGASPEVRVTSPEAVSALNQAGTSSAQIMATLQSDALVELLPVRREASGLHANVRLLMAGGLPLTLATVGPAVDLDALGDALASALAPHLRLDPETLHSAPRPSTSRGNDEALELYARGLRQSATESPEGIALACASFKASTAADPEFAAGYARWAQCLLTQYRFGEIEAPLAFEYARTAVSMALLREPDNPDARAALADLTAEEQHDWARAESEFHEALARDSSNVFARSRYAMLLAGRGRTAEAVEQLNEALRSAPMSTALKGYLAMGLHYNGRDEEALEIFQQLRLVDTALESAMVGQCRIFVVVGKFNDAVTTCRQLLLRRKGKDAFAQAQLAAALGRLGQQAESDRYLKALRAELDAAGPTDRPNVAFFLATAYAGLEQTDQVFPWLEIAARGKSSRLAYLRVDPRFAVVRADPRWAQILSAYDAHP